MKRSRLFALVSASLALSVVMAGVLAGPGAAQERKVAAKTSNGPAAANSFNRLFKGAANFNLPPAEDGIHDGESPGAHALQAPRTAFETLPNSKAGNRVDWVQAFNKGMIQPRAERLDPGARTTVLDMNIVRQVKGSMPDVVYPHKPHTQWLGCNQCHPKIFIPKKGANKISMAAILGGQYCGVCHGKVAFPLSECRLCHSKDKSPDELKERLKTARAHGGGDAGRDKPKETKVASIAPPAPPAAPAKPVAVQPLTPPATGDGPLEREALMSLGANVYADNCAGCHGEKGEGVPDTFPPLAGSRIVAEPVAAHLDTVLHGRPDTAMMAWKDELSPKEIAAVVTFERNAFPGGAKDVVQPAAVVAALGGGAPAGGDARAVLMERGAGVYADNCAGCHGENGEGVPETFPALAGSKLVQGAAEKHIAIVLNGRPETAMMAWRDELSAEEIAAVITYERNSWGNATGDIVTAAMVEAAKD